MKEEIDFGPVAVRVPGAELRIGYYDDDGSPSDEDFDESTDDNEIEDPSDETEMWAIVYFTQPPLIYSPRYEYVRYEHLAPIDTESLWERRDRLRVVIADNALLEEHGRKAKSYKARFDLAMELGFVSNLLADRLIEAREAEGRKGGRRVFISHSSMDKPLATSLAVDLANEGHLPWLDEWEIRAGESIPTKISMGVDECDFLLLLLSPNSTQSGWVEAEWSAKYWQEVQDGAVRVIPVLLADCVVPTLLRTKKYADLRSDYSGGLSEILRAVGSPQ
jgi:hypothetical protein